MPEKLEKARKSVAAKRPSARIADSRKRPGRGIHAASARDISLAFDGSEISPIGGVEAA
jgi:hypothetical protein